MTGPTPGSLGEEARRLAETLSEWGRTHGGPLADLGRAYAGPLADWARAAARTEPPPEAGAPPGPFSDWTHHRDGVPHAEPRPGEPVRDDACRSAECRFCPFCQLLAVLRGDRPDAAARLMTAGSAFVEALREVLVPSSEPPEEPPPTVQHIDVG